MGDEQLQFSQQLITWFKGGEVLAHPRQLRDEPRVAGVGLGLAAHAVARPVHCDAGRVEDPLLSLPQKRQQQRGAATGLVGGPDDVDSKREHLLNESREISLVVVCLAREEDLALLADRYSPVEALARVHAHPHPAAQEDRLLYVSGSEHLPPGLPAVGSLRSDLSSSPISMSGRVV